MKKSFLILAAGALILNACQNGADGSKKTPDKDTLAVETQDQVRPSMAYFGYKIDDEGAVDVNEATTGIEEEDSIQVKITGSIDKVCQVKGCWMTMPYGSDESMRVTFRDYAFFVPKDIDGKEVIIDGTLYTKTTSVEDLRHFAGDEGRTEEEIASITEPETSLAFIADGVIVKDYVVKTGSADGEELNLPAEDDHDHADGEHHH